MKRKLLNMFMIPCFLCGEYYLTDPDTERISIWQVLAVKISISIFHPYRSSLDTNPRGDSYPVYVTRIRQGGDVSRIGYVSVEYPIFFVNFTNIEYVS
jgi:hypothetical protein